jgi:hypothetical protein
MSVHGAAGVAEGFPVSPSVLTHTAVPQVFTAGVETVVWSGGGVIESLPPVVSYPCVFMFGLSSATGTGIKPR